MPAKLTRLGSLLLASLLAAAPAAGSETAAGTLRRQTQELLDAITTGSASVWDRYLDPEARYTDEEGRVFTKAQMVEQTKPLPQGISGSIHVIEFQATRHGDVAVTNHVDDESEDFHGHKLHCQYRTTDVWKKTPLGWRLIASQVLALRTDPPAMPLTARQRADYCGRYALTPEISYEIRSAGDALEGQQTGRKSETLRAEVSDVLFVPGKPRYRKVFVRGPDGHITGFAERREAWEILWTRLPD
jgi:hypothetical protein